MKKVRVLLADSHSQVRTQLAARLQREQDIELIGLTSNSGQTLRMALSNPPDVLLIDPMMRDGFGLANLRQIVARLPTTMIIVLTAYVDTALKMEFDRMGVSQILTKGLSSESLLNTIRSNAKFTALPVNKPVNTPLRV
ncbi:MAG: response regulator transcription factor [Anaerolineales bacterium]|nr:response regulator transcription factor [Anaerolineales bacterium]